MARFSGAAFRLVERRMTASLVAAGVCLTLLLPGDVLWINDEPALILLAMEANRAGVPASAGLPGTVGICYGPLAVWFYQLLLFCTAHPILLVTIKSTLVMLVSLAAIQRLGKELRFDWRLFGALFLLNPFLWHANRILWDNVLLLPLVCWLFALLPAYWRRGSPRTLAGIVALLGGMFWLHPMSAPLIGAFGITLLFRPDLLRRDRWKLAAAGLALLLVVGAILLHAEFGRQGIPRGEGAGIDPLWNLLLFLSGSGYLRYYLPEYLPSGSGLDVLFRIVTPPAAVAAGALMLLGCRFAWMRPRTGLIHMAGLFAMAALVLHFGMVFLLRMPPFQHYNTAAAVPGLLLMFFGFSAMKRFRRSAVLTAGLVLLLFTGSALLMIHRHGGSRSTRYGATLGTQWKAVQEVAAAARDGGVILETDVPNYRLFPQALRALLLLERKWNPSPPLPLSAPPSRTARITCRSASEAEGFLVVRFTGGNPQ